MYQTDPQMVLDQMTMMSRFYSQRTQMNTFGGGNIEQPSDMATLSDPYALQGEKQKYLIMNYQKLYGQAPVQKVMMYKGMEPFNEFLYDLKFNQAGSRYTNEDFRLLGETMYKGFSGLTSSRWQLLKDAQVQAREVPGRFSVAISGAGDIDYEEHKVAAGLSNIDKYSEGGHSDIQVPNRSDFGYSRSGRAGGYNAPASNREDYNDLDGLGDIMRRAWFKDTNDLLHHPQAGLPGGFQPAQGPPPKKEPEQPVPAPMQPPPEPKPVPQDPNPAPAQE